ncbi:hypothetical protein C4553_03555 [Candidatus Parcubacteria bacterium]|nr:MAG: hypothetical protein C4553_03555 [Candidatus Parcubacteria bacterium]
MNYLKNKWIILTLSIVLSFIAAKFIGQIYFKTFNSITGGLGPQPSCPECITGFLLSYLFFVSLLLNLLLFGQIKKFWIISLLPILIILLNPPYEELIAGIILVVVGFLLAQLILWVRRIVKGYNH